jgi:CRISPR-associated endoribonuclease Cas2 subtype I-E
MLKRWFIEPRANVFVGTLNRRTQEKNIDYIRRSAAGVGLLIISSYPNCQGYKMRPTARPSAEGFEISGLWMVAEKWEKEIPTARTEEDDF